MDPQSNPVTVLGQGALGTYLAVALRRAGHPVTVVSSRAETTEDVELAVTGRARMQATVERTPRPPETPATYLVVATRAGQAVKRARAAVDHLADDGLAVPMQNGLVSLDVAEALGPERVCPMVVGFNAGMVDASTVELTSPGGVTLGALAPAAKGRAEELAGSLEATMEAKVSANPRGAVWSKWTISCAINGLAVVAGTGVGPLSRDETGREALLHLVTECVRLAELEEVQLERVAGPLSPDAMAGSTSGLGGWFRGVLVRAIGRRYADVVPSSLDALRGGRDTELEELNGRAVSLGELHDEPVPWNKAVLEVGLEVVAGKQDPGWEALTEVAELAAR